MKRSPPKPHLKQKLLIDSTNGKVQDQLRTAYGNFKFDTASNSNAVPQQPYQAKQTLKRTLSHVRRARKQSLEPPSNGVSHYGSFINPDQPVKDVISVRASSHISGHKNALSHSTEFLA